MPWPKVAKGVVDGSVGPWEDCGGYGVPAMDFVGRRDKNQQEKKRKTEVMPTPVPTLTPSA